MRKNILNTLNAIRNVYKHKLYSTYFSQNGWEPIIDSDMLNLSQKGYYGIAFKNDKTKEVIIANAGSFDSLRSIFGDIICDLQISRHKIPEQFFFAKQFAQKIIREHPTYKIILTGHSLGGVLSELVNVALTEKGYTLTTYSYDSPGSLEIVQKLFVNKAINKKDYDIILFNTRDTWVNTLCTPIATEEKTYKVKPKKPTGVITDIINYVPYINTFINEHYFGNFRTAFDRETGEFSSSL